MDTYQVTRTLAIIVDRIYMEHLITQIVSRQSKLITSHYKSSNGDTQTVCYTEYYLINKYLQSSSILIVKHKSV